MARTISTDLADILADPTRGLDWTLDITLPTAEVLRFATSPMTLDGHDYTNKLQGIREIRQQLSGPIDRVNITLENMDQELGLAIGAAYDDWRRSEAVIGRYYYSQDRVLKEWIQMFSGTIQQPEITDLTVTTDIVSDVASAGQIVVTRTLAPQCPFKYKDSPTCGSTSDRTTCNHMLKSAGGCDGDANAHHFGGWEHRYRASVNAPGSGGNSGPVGGYCPRDDQWIPIDRSRHLVRAGEFKKGDLIWNPIEQRQDVVKSAERHEDQVIWQITSRNGASGFSSISHLVFPYREHTNGLAVTQFFEGDPVLMWAARCGIFDSKLVASQRTGERGTVVRIELESGHVYAYGDSTEDFFVCHNSKPNPYGGDGGVVL